MATPGSGTGSGSISRRPSWRRRRLSATRQAKSASEFNPDTICRAHQIVFSSARSNSFNCSPTHSAVETDNVLKKAKSLTKLFACIGRKTGDDSEEKSRYPLLQLHVYYQLYQLWPYWDHMPS